MTPPEVLEELPVLLRTLSPVLLIVQLAIPAAECAAEFLVVSSPRHEPLFCDSSGPTFLAAEKAGCQCLSLAEGEGGYQLEYRDPVPFAARTDGPHSPGTFLQFRAHYPIDNRPEDHRSGRQDQTSGMSSPVLTWKSPFERRSWLISDPSIGKVHGPKTSIFRPPRRACTGFDRRDGTTAALLHHGYSILL